MTFKGPFQPKLFYDSVTLSCYNIMLAKSRLYKLFLITCISIHEFDSTHDNRSEKLDFHRNTFLHDNTVSVIPQVLCQGDSSNIHPACLPGKGCCDRHRKVYPFNFTIYLG